MFKNFFLVFIFLFVFLFIYFIVSIYVSKKNKNKINLNRLNINSKIENRLSSLPLLKNDTQDIIEFNSGYDVHNDRIKRNFWNLFKNND